MARQSWKDWLAFTPAQRRGVVALLVLIVILVLLPLSYPYLFPKQQVDGDRFMEEAEAFLQQERQPVLVNLNTAPSWELTEVKGIGPSTAARIIAYRDSTGGFQSVDELLNIHGLGPKTLEKIRPYITVDSTVSPMP